jgi:hypothetical protein
MQKCIFFDSPVQDFSFTWTVIAETQRVYYRYVYNHQADNFLLSSVWTYSGLHISRLLEEIRLQNQSENCYVEF